MPRNYVGLSTTREGLQNGDNGEDFYVLVAVEGDLDFASDAVAARLALKEAYDQVDNVLDSIIKGAS